MYDIYKNIFLKKESNILGLSYLPSFIDPQLNDIDDAMVYLKPRPKTAVSECNLFKLQEILNGVDILNIVEIGVARDRKSFTPTLISMKSKRGIYCGIDLQDKTFLNDSDNNIFTIQANSHEQEKIRSYFKEIGLSSISVLFIDGWHSVNTVINDWQYTDLLDPNGVVILHDTNYHPGPNLILDAIDNNMFNVKRYCEDDDDFGLAVAYKLF